MPKRVPLTDQIKAHITNAVGDSIDFNSVVVFELTAITNRPIKQRGRLYDGAIPSDSMLKGMAEFLQAEGNFLPLHTLHQQGVQLPVGRVFYGEFLHDDDTGLSEVRSLAYLTADQTDFIQKLDTGVIDEVSSGVLAKQALCSECGWDFLGSESTFDNIWNCTCKNGHTVGEDGVHLNLIGLNRFYEISLVSLGASPGAKVQPRAKQVLASEEYQRLAAAGTPPEAVVLMSYHKDHEEVSMDAELKALLEKLSASSAQVTTFIAEINTAKADLAAKDAQIATLGTQVAKLTETEQKLVAAEAQVAALTASNKVALEIVQGAAKHALVASGKTDPKLPDTIEGTLEALKAAQIEVAKMFPIGGVSQTVIAPAVSAAEVDRLASFKLPK